MLDSYKQARSLDRWAGDKFVHSGLQEFLSTNLKTGVHTLEIDGPPLDLHLRVKRGKPLVVFFNGNAPRSPAFMLPAFSGLGVLPPEVVASRVCVSDPTLHLADDLCLSWYAGSHHQKLQELIPEILRHVFSIVQPSRIIFAGGSAGGFASLFYASFFPESLTCVWNPQTDIARYNPPHVIHYVRTAFGSAETFEQAVGLLKAATQTSLAPLYRAAQNHVIYLQNVSDWHTKRHLVPFLAELGLEAPAGPGQFRPRPNLHAYLGEWGDGHVPPPKEAIASLLQSLIETPETWKDLFAGDALPAMIKSSFDRNDGP